MKYHRKRVDNQYVNDEIEALKIADRIDPTCKYHIGAPEIETVTDECTTLKFIYGGKTLKYLTRESIDVINKTMKGIDNIMEGLIAFHNGGLYHRDVKSTNILYDESGHVRLIDFGIAEMLPAYGDEGLHDSIYNSIYTIWPFEVHLLSGETNIFSQDIFGEHISDKYFKPIIELHNLNTNDIRDNIICLRKNKTSVEANRDIFKGIDVYGLGMTISHLLNHPNVRQYLDNYQSVLRVTRKMVEPYTHKRISLPDALHEWRRCFKA